ncbi:Tolloid-like protein 1, partial [Bacillus cereus]|nr:Tolloid-like protein 1 [Bacillus cereus]
MSNNEALDHCVQMNLNDNQLIEASCLAIQENPDNAPDSYGVPKEAIDNNEMAFITAKKWKSGLTLRVRFLDGYTVIQEIFKKYANEWSRYA